MEHLGGLALAQVYKRQRTPRREPQAVATIAHSSQQDLLTTFYGVRPGNGRGGGSFFNGSLKNSITLASSTPAIRSNTPTSPNFVPLSFHGSRPRRSVTRTRSQFSVTCLS